MSLLDDYGMDNWLEYDSMNTELTNNINSIDNLYLKQYQSFSKIENINDNVINYDNWVKWSVDSAFLTWILIINFLYIHKFFVMRRRPMIMN